MRYLFRVRYEPDGRTMAYVGDWENDQHVKQQAELALAECKRGGLVRVYREGERLPMLVRVQRNG